MNSTMSSEMLTAMAPEKVIEILKEGNGRFVSGNQVNRGLLQQVEETANGQYPYGVVLGCVDSRVPLETVFDVGIGDIFGIRIAGNFVNEDILGSMEFACKVVGSKHILVLGHTSCGAINGAANNVELGNLTGLLNKLNPAVKAIRAITPEGSDLDMDAISKKNVELTIEEIKRNSPILNEMVENGEIMISGAIYDVNSGKVDFL